MEGVDLPQLRITTTFFALEQCGICRRPCAHEDERTGQPYPGAYDAAAVDDPERPPVPVCDACVERHYAELVPEVEAARLHYWIH